MLNTYASTERFVNTDSLFIKVCFLQEFLNSGQMTDAGPLELIDDSDDERSEKILSVPGVRKGKVY